MGTFGDTFGDSLNAHIGAVLNFPVPVTPYYVETLAGFSFNGSVVPSNLTPYTGGNLFLGISGNAGDSFVTVTSGTIGDIGTGQWTAVIKDDTGKYKQYAVLSCDGINKINIYPNLSITIASGQIANVHDSNLGQHLTERGYRSLAQHIYNSSTKYSEKNKYIKKFNGTDTSAGSPWTLIGGPFLTYNYSSNIVLSSVLLRQYTTPNLDAYCFANGVTQGLQMIQDITGKNGYLELFAGCAQNEDVITAEFYLDNVLISTVSNFGKCVKRLLFPFSGASSAKVKIFIANNAVVHNIVISSATFWINEATEQIKILPDKAKIVYLGDSWGVYNDSAICSELSSLVGKTVINKAVGGMTSAWGLSWFENYVLNEHPTHAIIEFFVNDYNSASGGYTTFLAPDGSTQNLTVTKEQWRTNIRDMAALAIANKIQPIIVCPSATGSQSQTQGLSQYNLFLTEGTLLT